MGTSSSKRICLWLFCGIFLLAGYAWGAPAGFTPEASIAISFPKATFNAGEETTAYITISGKTNGATIIATITGLGIAETTVDVSNGGGSVAVTVPSIAGNYSYSASATIGGQAVLDETTITVTANHPPVATNTTATTPEDTPCQLTFSATDPDNDTLTFSSDSPYSYTPPADFNGEDIVYFTVSDGNGGIAEGTVTITVTPVNDAPVAWGGEIATNEDIPVDISLFAYDVDGDDISYTVVTAPSHGTLSTIDPDTGETSYTPTADWYGTDTFTFKVNDGLLDSDTATVTIVVNPVGDRVTLTLAKYLLADGQDSSSVSLYVVDENDDPLPNETVTLSTTGGTLTDTTLVTDANGVASTTLTSSTTVGAVSVKATIEDDEDAQTVTFFTFALQVSDAIAVPNSTPAMYAVGLGKEDEVVTVSLITTPDVDLTDASIALDWDGGNGTEDDQRTVAKDASGQSSVSVELRGSEQTVEIVVIEVTAIIADSTPLSLIDDDSYSPGKKHAVTTWTATSNTNAALKATVSPDVTAVHAMYNQFLLWSGGQAGTTPDKRIFSRNAPSKTEITVRCGESSDAVTAWVSKVNIAIAGVSDSQEDSVSATIYPNTDDDNFSATSNPPYNGSDLDETSVNYENDLVPITITVEPIGIGGTLTLTHDEKIAIYRNKDKSGTLPTGLSWNLSSLLNTDPIDDETPPAILWVEGREISALPGDQEITLSWEWGDELCDDTVKATVQARAGESEASIRVVSLGSNGEPGLEKYDPIGGMMYLALQIKLGPGERLEQSMSTVTVKAQDDYAYTGSPASFTATWNLGNASEWWELINPGTAQAQWVAASAAPNNVAGNRDGSLARIYCSMKEWDTPFTPSLPFTPPMGHNGEHTLKIVQVNGVDGDELSFQHYVVPTWQTAYQKVVPPQKAVVRNLIVTNVKTSYGTLNSNGSEDYFKYDPDPESPYNRPTISFTIEDDGAPHEYDAYILMWPTSVTGSLFQGLTTADAIAWTEDLHLSAGEYSKTWDGSYLPDTWAGYAADESPWSTYAFEVMVFEYPDQNATRNQYIDWFYLRWPYCMYITNDEHHVYRKINTAMQEVPLEDPDTGEVLIDPYSGEAIGWQLAEVSTDEELRCDYILRDYAHDQVFPNFNNSKTLTLTVIDRDFQEHPCLENVQYPAYINTFNNGSDGHGILAWGPSKDGLLGWRVVFTGEDSCWIGYRRDHQPTRLLAVNAVKGKKEYAAVFKGWISGAGTDLEWMFLRDVFSAVGYKLVDYGITDDTKEYVSYLEATQKIIEQNAYKYSAIAFLGHGDKQTKGIFYTFDKDEDGEHNAVGLWLTDLTMRRPKIGEGKFNNKNIYKPFDAVIGRFCFAGAPSSSFKNDLHYNYFEGSPIAVSMLTGIFKAAPWKYKAYVRILADKINEANEGK